MRLPSRHPSFASAEYFYLECVRTRHWSRLGDFPPHSWVTFSCDREVSHCFTEPGIIVPINRTYFDTVLFYTTIPILDSADALGPTYNLVPPLYNATSSIQIFGCSQSRMNQTVVVDSQSRSALSLAPDLEKTTSKWSAYTGPVDRLGSPTVSPGFNTTGNLFLELVSAPVSSGMY